MTISASELIEKINELKHIHEWDSKQIVRYIAFRCDRFDHHFVREIFDLCHLKPMEGINAVTHLDFHTNDIEYHSAGGYFMPTPVKENYKLWLQEQLDDESTPEKKQVGEDLAKIATKVVDPNERIFYDETYKNLQIGSYRSAIVMGWNLAYDHFLRWLLSDANRLVNFNSVLITRNQKRTFKYDSVKVREDFNEIKESIVIEICHNSGLITYEDRKVLESALGDRNTYAHPSCVPIDQAIASVHVSKLVKRIVLKYPI
jgi:hypothetical protein